MQKLEARALRNPRPLDNEYRLFLQWLIAAIIHGPKVVVRMHIAQLPTQWHTLVYAFGTGQDDGVTLGYFVAYEHSTHAPHPTPRGDMRFLPTPHREWGEDLRKLLQRSPKAWLTQEEVVCTVGAQATEERGPVQSLLAGHHLPYGDLCRAQGYLAGSPFRNPDWNVAARELAERLDGLVNAETSSVTRVIGPVIR